MCEVVTDDGDDDDLEKSGSRNRQPDHRERTLEDTPVYIQQRALSLRTKL